jgi:predicted DNA-binding protein (MmcQ/YjbR family)
MAGKTERLGFADFGRSGPVCADAVSCRTWQAGPVDGVTIRRYALDKPGARADEPREGDPVVKIGSQVFAFLGEDTVGVKCAATQEEADAWLARYPDDAAPMPSIGRSGWNVLRLHGAIPDEELLKAVDVSYDLVVSNLAKGERPTAWRPSPR